MKPVPHKSRGRPARRRGFFLLFAAIALIPACTNVTQTIDQQQAAAAQRWQELARSPDAPVAMLGWAEAVKKMEATNPKLLKARDSVRAGEEAVRQIPYNYIPELTLNVFAYPTLDTVAGGSLGDTFLLLGALINLPNPVQYRAEALQTRLRYLDAQLECESLRRDLRVKLYLLFRKSSRLARTETEAAALARLGQASPDSPASRQARELALQNHRAGQDIESELAELLGDYSHRWQAQPAAGLPVLDYARHPPALDGSDHFGRLQIMRAALQLVALDAQRQGSLVAEWPQVSVLVSAPPVYQRSFGRESYLSLGDIRLSAFLTYSTDFRGNRALSREQSARSAGLTRRELDVAMQATLRRLKDAVGLLAELNARETRLRSAGAALHATGAVVEAAALDEQAVKIETDTDELNLSLWVLDDPRWQPSS